MEDDLAYQPIENYGVIGDLNTVALVGKNGSIDFLCFPDFDSPTVFARLLDDEKGGYFQIEPTSQNRRESQLYLSDTNVLFSRFLLEGGVAELSDFMPIETERVIPNLVRRVKAVRGTTEFHMSCQPAFNYALSSHQVNIEGNQAIFSSQGEDGLSFRLRSDVPLEITKEGVSATFSLKGGETAAFIFEQIIPGQDSPCDLADYVSEAFKRTVNFWHDWIERSTYRGHWQDEMNRSALTLKLLTSQVYGSMVAAPTFGLPEVIGGERNWDYRYSWIRDSAFMVYALIRLGFTSEAEDYLDWIRHCVKDLNPDGSMQIMYRLDGGEVMEERHLDHLEGYKGSTPVRIGNQAYQQLQLDIYGELLDAVYLVNKYGNPISHDMWNRIRRMVTYVIDHWQEPDEGIWETRGGKRHFLFSRLMCWVAVDRALRLAGKRSFPAPYQMWEGVRDEIYEDIHENFWDEEKGAFVQYKGGKALDASSLLLPLVRFISPTDPRWLSHLKAVEEELVYDSLVYRYSSEVSPDGLEGEEGTFSICTFWYVECLSRAGQLQKARFYFEKMLGYANHLGLYAEELSPQAEHLGNFPQAFTHLALISAAYDLDRRLNRGT